MALTYSVSDISVQNYFFANFYDAIGLSRLLQEDCCIYDFVLSLGYRSPSTAALAHTKNDVAVAPPVSVR